MPNLFDQINPAASLSNVEGSPLDFTSKMFSGQMTGAVNMVSPVESVVDTTIQKQQDPYNIAGSKGALIRERG